MHWFLFALSVIRTMSSVVPVHIKCDVDYEVFWGKGHASVCALSFWSKSPWFRARECSISQGVLLFLIVFPSPLRCSDRPRGSGSFFGSLLFYRQCSHLQTDGFLNKVGWADDWWTPGRVWSKDCTLLHTAARGGYTRYGATHTYLLGTFR